MGEKERGSEKEIVLSGILPIYLCKGFIPTNGSMHGRFFTSEMDKK